MRAALDMHAMHAARVHFRGGRRASRTDALQIGVGRVCDAPLPPPPRGLEIQIEGGQHLTHHI
jgi:hypothetical protein